ncbi:hypothetical protein EYF80_025077 [Liparis tanakae]|uniref:Uncharacterized protein n=1 Tax=Liparis tanakae TaxID=230148 RepID=A0A4Z2HGL6_9TELE|nr:hypothetical protein EYF80_025077 [Liparis tanakae]
MNDSVTDTNLSAPSLQATARRQPSVLSSTATRDMYLKHADAAGGNQPPPVPADQQPVTLHLSSPAGRHEQRGERRRLVVASSLRTRHCRHRPNARDVVSDDREDFDAAGVGTYRKDG